MMAMAGMMLASCMGDSYADPEMVETIPAPPYGNNLLREKNVVTIAHQERLQDHHHRWRIQAHRQADDDQGLHHGQ